MEQGPECSHPVPRPLGGEASTFDQGEGPDLVGGEHHQLGGAGDAGVGHEVPDRGQIAHDGQRPQRPLGDQVALEVTAELINPSLRILGDDHARSLEERHQAT